jgi:hypothetical protein
MALLAVAAPTTATSGLAGINSTLAGSTALTGNTGLTVPWNANLVVLVWSGATAAGVVNLLKADGTSVFATVTLLTLGLAVFANIPFNCQNSSGLIQVNVTTVTTAAASAYLALNAVNVGHSPIEMTATATDY